MARPAPRIEFDALFDDAPMTGSKQHEPAEAIGTEAGATAAVHR